MWDDCACDKLDEQGICIEVVEELLDAVLGKLSHPGGPLAKAGETFGLLVRGQLVWTIGNWYPNAGSETPTAFCD